MHHWKCSERVSPPSGRRVPAMFTCSITIATVLFRFVATNAWHCRKSAPRLPWSRKQALPGHRGHGEPHTCRGWQQATAGVADCQRQSLRLAILHSRRSRQGHYRPDPGGNRVDHLRQRRCPLADPVQRSCTHSHETKRGTVAVRDAARGTGEQPTRYSTEVRIAQNHVSGHGSGFHHAISIDHAVERIVDSATLHTGLPLQSLFWRWFDRNRRLRHAQPQGKKSLHHAQQGDADKCNPVTARNVVCPTGQAR